MKENILIIGCGEIGSCLIDGWLTKNRIFSKKIKKISIIETNLSRRNFLKKKYSSKINFLQDKEIKSPREKFKNVFLAVKPKDFGKKLDLYNELFDKNTTFFSLLAGKNISSIKTLFPNNKNIIRLMLNTQICINQGTIIYTSLKRSMNRNNEILLKMLGNIYYVNNEKYFDVFTAIVGSGPAFFYYLVEAMENAAIKSGLERKLAKELLIKTFKGTGAMISHLNCDAKHLRNKVTSKGGTTEAAINHLQKSGFKKVISSSLKKAILKSKEFSRISKK